MSSQESYLTIINYSTPTEMENDYDSNTIEWTRKHSSTYRQLQVKVENKKHSDAIKSGIAAWLQYKNEWLIKLEEFPMSYGPITYKEKICYISKMWKIAKELNMDNIG